MAIPASNDLSIQAQRQSLPPNSANKPVGDSWKRTKDADHSTHELMVKNKATGLEKKYTFQYKNNAATAKEDELAQVVAGKAFRHMYKSLSAEQIRNLDDKVAKSADGKNVVQFKIMKKGSTVVGCVALFAGDGPNDPPYCWSKDGKTKIEFRDSKGAPIPMADPEIDKRVLATFNKRKAGYILNEIHAKESSKSSPIASHITRMQRSEDILKQLQEKDKTSIELERVSRPLTDVGNGLGGAVDADDEDDKDVGAKDKDKGAADSSGSKATADDTRKRHKKSKAAASGSTPTTTTGSAFTITPVDERAKRVLRVEHAAGSSDSFPSSSSSTSTTSSSASAAAPHSSLQTEIEKIKPFNPGSASLEKKFNEILRDLKATNYSNDKSALAKKLFELGSLNFADQNSYNKQKRLCSVVLKQFPEHDFQTELQKMFTSTFPEVDAILKKLNPNNYENIKSELGTLKESKTQRPGVSTEAHKFLQNVQKLESLNSNFKKMSAK